jgi:dsDNA-binding SOS-regulon protein
LNEENILAGKRLDMMLDLAKELLNDVQTAIYQLADDRVKELSVPRF